MKALLARTVGVIADVAAFPLYMLLGIAIGIGWALHAWREDRGFVAEDLRS